MSRVAAIARLLPVLLVVIAAHGSVLGQGFPPAGTDLSPSSGVFRVDVFQVGPVDTRVDGEILLQWQDPVVDPGTGQRTVQTEMLSMDLTGAHPSIGNLNVRAGALFGLPPTNGRVDPVGTGGDFPALATFDVFFEVEVSGVATLRNSQPLVMQAVIDQIPPRNIGLQNQNPVQLVDIVDPLHIDTLETAIHWMCPPPFPPPGIPCPVPCDQTPFPACEPADCPPGSCSLSGAPCTVDADCGGAGDTCTGPALQCIPNAPLGICECAAGFPPAGTDLSPSTGIFRVDIPNQGTVDTSVSGEILLEWQAPAFDPVSGQRTVQTEMLSMDLSGSDPSIGSLNLRAGILFGLPPTLGSVVPIAPGREFPARASFDVFFEVEVLGVTTLRNPQALVMEADINEIPPRNIGLENLSAVLLQDVADPTQVGILQQSFHWMCPPPFPPPGIPCPVPCDRTPFPICSPGTCPGVCSNSGASCQNDGDCTGGATDTCLFDQCRANDVTQTCECAPGFPPNGGTDLSPTTGLVRVDVLGVGPVDLSVSGETLLQFSAPNTDPGTGERSVQTEMLALDLSGSNPQIGSVNVRAGSQFGLPPTTGTVVPLGSSDFPATASFDVFFEVEVDGTSTLRNNDPLPMTAVVNELPPRDIGLQNEAEVQIIDIVDPQHIDTIQTAFHWMCPPPFPPPGIPCPLPCDRAPFPVCLGDCDNANERCAEIPTVPGQGICRCVPDSFPPAGVDLSPTTGIVRVDVLGVGPVDVFVAGESLIEFQDPVVDPVSGQRTVQTEMLSLDLSGSNPRIGSLNVRAGVVQGQQPTLGTVVPAGPDGDFPATASFDVFFEVEVDGTTTLRNNDPLPMQAQVSQIPPRNIGLQNLAQVQIIDIADPQHIDTIQTAFHWMCPPPFPPPGVPCPVPCDQNPFPVCSLGDCPTDRPLCVPDDATQSCTCVEPFPPGGLDLSPTTGIVRVDVFGIGPVDAKVTGETLLSYSDPQTDPVSGQRTVQTEMVSLSLSGNNPLIGDLNVRAGADFGLPPTLGSVVPLDPTGPDFPATASFDVFFEVEVDGQTTLRNNDPLPMRAQVISVPPRNLGLQNIAEVDIIDIVDPQHIDTIQTAFHWMCPPPFPPPGVPCPVPCDQTPFPVCSQGDCPPGLICTPDSGACQCLLPPPVGSGEVPCVGTPLRVAKAGAGQITLTWGPSCLGSDNDYEIYEGIIPLYDTHSALFCTTGGLLTKTFAPVPANESKYYLVPPRNATEEGSYGVDGGGTQRPVGAPQCLTRVLGVCP